MGHELYFSVRLLTNTIVSQSSATSGDHECLSFIPGSNFLGVAASKLYSTLSQEQAYQVFHSGAVRFGDALPGEQQQQAWPIPFCWHHIKGEELYDVKVKPALRLDETKVFDPTRVQLEPGKQPKQLRTGHVMPTGQLLEAQKDYEMKTAINPNTGAAAESQLFGYQSLQAGQEFIFSLSFDSAVDKDLISQVKNALLGSAFIGRSRSAQFGQVVIEEAASFEPINSLSENNTQLRLWLLSDLALMDELGNPLLTPTAQALSLPAGSQWLADQSFIRTRSYTPFNAKRRCYDLERQVIARGSVLVFQLSQALGNDALQALNYIGQYQEAGLGRVAVNPALLSTPTPKFSAYQSVAAAEKKEVDAPNSLLIRTLQNKQKQSAYGQEVEKQVQAMLKDIHKAYQSAAGWAGVSLEQLIETSTPSISLWSEVRATALAHVQEPLKLKAALFDGQHAVIRERKGQTTWMLPLSAEESLAQRLKTIIDAIDEKELSSVLAQTCTRLMSDKRLANVFSGEQA